MKVKQCKYEGCESTKIWSKGFCRFHTPKTPLKSSKSPIKKSGSIKKITDKQIEKNKLKAEKTKRLHKWFIDEIWNKRPHYSEISGRYLGEEPNTCFFHHVFCKSSHEDLEFIAENIIVLTPDEHTTVEANPTKFEEVNKRREYLKQKYGK